MGVWDKRTSFIALYISLIPEIIDTAAFTLSTGSKTLRDLARLKG